VNTGWSIFLWLVFVMVITAALWDEDNVWKRIAVFAILSVVVMGLRLDAYFEGKQDGQCDLVEAIAENRNVTITSLPGC
jgi:uncharacterized membrane protein